MKTKFLWFAIPALALLAWLSVGKSGGKADGHVRVDGKAARQLVQAGARLLDVRTAAEFATQHIPDAINIPVQDLPARINELEPKDRAIVVYCRSGHRSGMAYEALKTAGFTRLADLGPMTAW